MNIDKSSVRGLQHYPLVQQIELWPIDKLIPYAKNPRTHSDAQVAQIAGSIAAFGFNAPILVDSHAGVIAGHGRLLASRQLGLQEVPVIVLDHLSEIQRRAYLIADNKLGENAGWDDDLLREQLAELRDSDIGLETLGFADDELRELLQAAENDSVPSDEGEIPEATTDPVTRPGDIWQIKRHRLICGDCRDPDVVGRLFDGAQANMVFTSPPYATQREYDPSSGFQPVRPEEYCNWFRDVARNVATVLAPDGSYFLNIKEHAEDGERSLYVKDWSSPTSGSGAGGLWMSCAGARQITACRVAGTTGSRTPGSPCSTSAGNHRSNSGRRKSATCRRTVSNTRPTTRNQHPEAACLALAVAVRRRARTDPILTMGVSPVWRGRATSLRSAPSAVKDRTAHPSRELWSSSS